MKSGGNVWVWHWRQVIVDALIGAATIAVLFAATGVTGQILFLYMVLIAGALVGIGLMLEPDVTAQRGRDIAPQPLRPPAEAKPARPEPWTMAHLDEAIVEATSV